MKLSDSAISILTAVINYVDDLESGQKYSLPQRIFYKYIYKSSDLSNDFDFLETQKFDHFHEILRFKRIKILLFLIFSVLLYFSNDFDFFESQKFNYCHEILIFDPLKTQNSTIFHFIRCARFFQRFRLTPDSKIQ